MRFVLRASRAAPIVAGLLALATPAARAGDERGETIESLVAKLGARRHVDRAGAGLALVARGRLAIPALAKALEDPDVLVRAVASEVLGMIGDPSAIGPLKELLVREAARVGTTPPPDLMAAREALRALAGLGDEGLLRVRAMHETPEPNLAPLARLAFDAYVQHLAEMIEPHLRRAEQNGSYAGQFEWLRKFGKEVIPTLSSLAESSLGSNSDREHVAEKAVRAIGDVGIPGSPEAESAREALEKIAALRERRSSRGSGQDPILSAVAQSEFRLGFPRRLDETIADLARDTASIQTGRQDPNRRFALGMAFLHRGEYEKSIAEFRSVVRSREGDFVNAAYNIACAYALWGRSREALAALRAVVTTRDGYNNEAWLCQDGDLRSIRETGEFRYVVALLRAKTSHPILGPDDPSIPLILEALREAAARGYRGPPATDAREIFAGLSRLEEFRRLWETLGGQRIPPEGYPTRPEAAQPPEPDPDPGDEMPGEGG